MDSSKDKKEQNESFKNAVNEGLSASIKKLPSRFIYDDNGSRLFEAIMELPEYYLTNAEKSIFEENGREVIRQIDAEAIDLVELGAGNGEKTKYLIEALLEDQKTVHYAPVDISKAAVKAITQKLHHLFPNLPVKGKVADYFEALEEMKEQSSRPKLVLFIGSNIGNFEPQERSHFLKALCKNLQKGDCIYIGFDLKKKPKMLNAAYNDEQKVTEAFNFNLLERINRELGGQFDLDAFQFYAAYEPMSGAVKSYILSKKEQKVYIESLDKYFSFDAWEPIHTESSFKFSCQEVAQMAKQHAFTCEKIIMNSDKTFAGAVWKV